MRSLLIGVGVFLAAWLLAARSAAGQRDPFADDSRGIPGHPEASGRTTTADLVQRIQKRHYSLDWEYIVGFDLAYTLTRDGRFAGHCQTQWNPANGLQISFDQSPERADCPKDEVTMMLQSLWHRSLMLSPPEKDVTSVATGEGIELRRKDEQGMETWKVASDGTVMQIAYRGREPGELLWTPKYHEREGKLYVESMTFSWGPEGPGHRTVEYTPSYTVQDGVVLLKALKMTRQLGDGTPGGEWTLSLDDAKVMKIDNTGRGLQTDRVEAFIVVMAAGDLRSDDAQKRLDACKVLERIGPPHARKALPLLKQVAERDANDGVRRAAASAVARIEGGGGAVTTDPTPRLPPKPKTDPRIVGSWVGRFDLHGIGHEERISYTADGVVHTILVNQFGQFVWNQKGTYTFEDGVLNLRIPGRRTTPCNIEFESDDVMLVEVLDGATIRYLRQK